MCTQEPQNLLTVIMSLESLAVFLSWEAVKQSSSKKYLAEACFGSPTYAATERDYNYNQIKAFFHAKAVTSVRRFVIWFTERVTIYGYYKNT